MKDNKKKANTTKKNTTKKEITKKIISKNKTNNKKETKKKKSKKKLIINIILIIILSGIIITIIAVSIFFSMIVKKAPEFDPKNLYTQESSIVYTSDGTEIAKLGTEKREKITYDDMPQILIDAIVATEDSTFFQHNGFNAARFLKASLSQVLGGGGGGASTLTMQVSKNGYTSNVSEGVEGIKRKFTDIYMSIFKIEKTYTKKEILEFYVNSYYMGGGAYGVEQACQNYFNKSVNNINLAEAAMLAGIYQAPGYYDPTINPENTEQRRKTVLNLMLRHGYITEQEKEIAEQLTVEKILHAKNTDGSDQIDPRYKDFIDTLVEDVKQKTGYNPYTTPMLIYATMDAQKQEYVRSIMNGTNFNWENDKVQAGIAVIDTNTGAVVAIGAGRHRDNETGWNYATMNRRHIGSTSKPLYDYGPLIEYNNASTYHLFYDEPYSYSNGTSMHNYDNEYKGFIKMRDALMDSRNVPALKAFQQNTNSNIYEFVNKLGLSPETSDGFIHEAHAIGAYGNGKTSGENPLSVAAAYAAFANGGYYTKPYTFTKIIYRNNDEVYEYKPETAKVMSEATAYMITDILKDTSNYYFKTKTINGIEFGSKTGTSNFDDDTRKANNLNSKAVNDLWIAGFCRDYATAIWYGYDRIYSDAYNLSSNGQHKKIYRKLIENIYEGTSSFTRPNSVVNVTIEKDSPGDGYLPSEYTPDEMKITTELFKAGTEPTTVSKRFSKLDNVKNLTSSIVNNKIKLEWTAIDTPNSLNHDYFKNLYKDDCRNADACASRIIEQNKQLQGELKYHIYLKNNGKLEEITSTTETNTTIEIPTNVGNTAIIVVRAEYEKNKKASSDGVETKIEIGHAIIDATLIGQKEITLKEGAKYIDAGVKVLQGTTDVTGKATIELLLNGKKVNNIEITKEGTYTIKYEITYNNFKKTLERKVIVKKAETTPTPQTDTPTPQQ